LAGKNRKNYIGKPKFQYKNQSGGGETMAPLASPGCSSWSL